jgi:hypothetical protein
MHPDPDCPQVRHLACECGAWHVLEFPADDRTLSGIRCLTDDTVLHWDPEPFRREWRYSVGTLTADYVRFLGQAGRDPAHSATTPPARVEYPGNQKLSHQVSNRG